MKRTKIPLHKAHLAIAYLITAVFELSAFRVVDQVAALQPLGSWDSAHNEPPVLTPNGAGPALIGDVVPLSEAVDAVGKVRIEEANPGVATVMIEEMSSDPDAFVDRNGRLLYLDQGLATGIESANATNLTASHTATTSSAVTSLSDTFLLESRPGSNRTIYLDFDGASVVGTAWNDHVGEEAIIAPPFDRDNDPTSFSEYERTFIQEVWSQVAEDFAPFDVNVTTKDLGESAYTRQNYFDNNFGSHVVVTNEVVGDVCFGFSCAGIAYVGTFDSQFSDYYQPAWAFLFDYGPLYSALVISHEVGHNLGLSHDGKSGFAYYGGHGSWGPIMGGGASRPIFQWSKGDYADPTNTENDYEVMSDNGLSVIEDDYADDPNSASLTSLITPIEGIISTQDDVDFFKMEISEGTLNLRVTPATHSPNLDVQLDLYDSTGTVLLAQSNDPSGYSDTQNSTITFTSTGMGASVSYNSPSSQIVYVQVSGVGEGDPLTTGYNDYGSLGRYSLSRADSQLDITVYGPGTVSSAASGISCSEICSSRHDPSTYVQLVAVPSADATVAYWLGSCEAIFFDLDQTTTCTVPMDQAREVVVVFRYYRTVTVSTVGSGNVSTTTNGWNISCSGTCSDTNWRPYVTLTAVAFGESVFSAWSGGCTTEVTTCTLKMTDSRSVTALFVTESAMNVSIVGNGSVVANPGGISCDGPTIASPCSYTYGASEIVTLDATPDATHVFTGWSGACSGKGTCTLSMNAVRDVTATFERSATLSIEIIGIGTVDSNLGSFSCLGPTSGSLCTQNYAVTETVELIANPDDLHTFEGWSGACSGIGVCTVTMSEARSVTATFVRNMMSHLVQVSFAGEGAGIVESNPGTIVCSAALYAQCAEYFLEGTEVILTATDGPGFFTGWAGACSGSSRTCVVTIGASLDVIAIFEIGDVSYVKIRGEGTLISSQGWMDCKKFICTNHRPSGSSVEITAVPAVGSNFVGWKSDCIGLGKCSLPTKRGAIPLATFVKQSPIVAGENFSCRIAGAGAMCWGDNSSGQIGNNSLTSVKTSTRVNRLTSVAAISAGGQHGCAVLENGTAKCWGENNNGQLGNRSKIDAKTPVLVSGLSDVQTISAGSAHTCALMRNGTVKCWGMGKGGRLGNGTMMDKIVPTLVSGISERAPAVAISAGSAHTCALMRNGTVKCWGDNSSGQLGNGSFKSAVFPTKVGRLSDVQTISAGSAHTCALMRIGTVKCWGENNNGQLGNNSTLDTKLPVLVRGVSGATMISAGRSHTCSNAKFGSNVLAMCWGTGENGRLGAGDTVARNTAVAVLGISSPKALSAGGSHTCVAIQNMSSRKLIFKCWGSGIFGQLGNNSTSDQYLATRVL